MKHLHSISNLLMFVAGAALVLATIGIFTGSSNFHRGGMRSVDLVDQDSYQAVFLDNGEVYFGKLAGETNSELVLTDIYYLRVEQNLQPATESVEETQAQPQISLVKLGNELHGPQDRMVIPHTSYIYWENLTENSQVVKTIAAEKLSRQNAETPETPSTDIE